MDLILERDPEGHLSCTLVDRDETATIVAPAALEAAADLEAAVADARESGYGECVWPLTDGEYKWLFRRSADRTDIVVLWSGGVVTGWQHVFRSEADAADLERRVAEEVARVRQGRL